MASICLLLCCILSIVQGIRVSFGRLDCLGYAPLCILQLHCKWLAVEGPIELSLQWCLHCRVTVGWLRIWGGFGWMMMAVWVSTCSRIWTCPLGTDQATCGPIPLSDELWWCYSHWARPCLKPHTVVLPCDVCDKRGPCCLLPWWEPSALPSWPLLSKRLSHWAFLCVTPSMALWKAGGSVQCPSLMGMSMWGCGLSHYRWTQIWIAIHPSCPDFVSWKVRGTAQILVNTLSLAIHLRVISCRSCHSDLQKLTQRSGEVQYELCPSVADHLLQ